MRYPIQITKNILIGPMLRGFGVRPDNSHVDLESDALTVRMGMWFNKTIALDDIASMAPMPPSEWPLWAGLGVKLTPRHGVGVVASREGIVCLGFKRPQPMGVVIISVDAENLLVSLEDPDGFLRALSQATGLLVSPAVRFWGGPA
jgi:hypothetical protein